MLKTYFLTPIYPIYCLLKRKLMGKSCCLNFPPVTWVVQRFNVFSLRLPLTLNTPLTLHFSHCTLHTACYTLHTALCTIQVKHCFLHTALCTMHYALFKGNTAFFTLHIASSLHIIIYKGHFISVF